MAQKISVIIPVLNEGEVLIQTLTSLQPLRARGHEVIVVDGGSKEASLTQPQLLADQVIRGPKGRSRQMNAGAIIARGEIFLFLHADTLLPEGADNIIISEHGETWEGLGPFRCLSLR